MTSLPKWLRGLFRKDAMDATAKSEINTGGGTFSETTDSLEAIRDTAPLGTAMRGTDGAYTGTPPSTADIKTALEIDGGKLDHLWEMTEDDGGVRRLTANALEQGPVTGAAPTVQQIRAEIDTNSTQLAAIVEDTGTTLPATLAALPAAIDVELSAVHGAGDWGVGIGASTVVYTVYAPDGVTPDPGVAVRMTTDAAGLNSIDHQITNAAGQVTLHHDLAPGTTVYIWRYKADRSYSDPDVEEIP